MWVCLCESALESSSFNRGRLILFLTLCVFILMAKFWYLLILRIPAASMPNTKCRTKGRFKDRRSCHLMGKALVIYCLETEAQFKLQSVTNFFLEYTIKKIFSNSSLLF